ncbi:MAG: helix-turn-helix domain-containing protein [bacterium]
MKREKIVTTQEAAAILGVHPGTFKRWKKQGHIKSIGRGKRNTPLFKKTQIVNFQPKTGTWVSWQERILVKGYNIEGLFRKELARKIGKTIWAIGSKSSRLGLSKYNKREFYFLKDVADLLQTNRSRVKRWIKSGKLEAAPICSNAGRIRYRISEENIVKFMAFYPQNWQDLKPIINLLALPEYKKLNCAKNCTKA